MRIAVALILLGSCCLGFAEDVPRVTRVEAMDRWIDLSWTDQGKPDNGFAVAVSRNGQDFEIAERVGPEARSASVFVDKRPFSLSGWGGNLYLRVAALDAAGKPGAWSEAVSVKPAKPRDIEAEVRQRFDYWEIAFTYNPNDPACTVIYTDAQKSEQREAANTMVADTVPNCGVACGIELGSAFTIHPPNKQEVGRRLALVALEKTYSQKIESSGPRYSSLKIEGNSIRITFTHANGLNAKGGTLNNVGPWVPPARGAGYGAGVSRVVLLLPPQKRHCVTCF